MLSQVGVAIAQVLAILIPYPDTAGCVSLACQAGLNYLRPGDCSRWSYECPFWSLALWELWDFGNLLR